MLKMPDSDSLQSVPGTMMWDDAIHTIPEDGAAYGVHAALTQSFNMCLSIEDFQFRCILGFP
jgi:hypothetical protein